jgi:hypothetical protein
MDVVDATETIEPAAVPNLTDVTREALLAFVTKCVPVTVTVVVPVVGPPAAATDEIVGTGSL